MVTRHSHELKSRIRRCDAYATLRTYVWSTDLSGSRSGAGGVGGLLLVKKSQTTGGLPTGMQFVAYDGTPPVSGQAVRRI